jgi:hypothetical protein
MPPRRNRITRTMLATFALTATTAAAAPANTGLPNIHTPHLVGADSEFIDPVSSAFGGTIDVYIGNSDDNTVVKVCVSSHCRHFPQTGSNYYGAAASYFDLELKTGQRRTVEIWAANGDDQQHWCPAKMTVR